MGETSWTFLLIGSFAALGAALAVGTLAAIVRYHRTGAFPGGGAGGGEEVSTGRLLALWVRVGIGVVVFAGGLWGLGRAGVL